MSNSFAILGMETPVLLLVVLIALLLIGSRNAPALARVTLPNQEPNKKTDEGGNAKKADEEGQNAAA